MSNNIASVMEVLSQLENISFQVGDFLRNICQTLNELLLIPTDDEAEGI